jgi:hypothetical protein
MHNRTQTYTHGHTQIHTHTHTHTHTQTGAFAFFNEEKKHTEETMNMNHVLKALKREGTQDFGKSVSMSQSSDEEVRLRLILKFV